eukprot:CAMPEP_0174990300 /NCGR_PEP_ID=MMETSP0004_2-20121128/21237_1 /TAXON_ID=420556 /ORGANISM="Ochromonas sp., Strain CCMP1393" /LENGTH=402 /DNA_ID=CAMNT_0016243877 /DNA_START=168 /DNA_END=1376 /DNA_ORIENTATION=-
MDELDLGIDGEELLDLLNDDFDLSDDEMYHSVQSEISALSDEDFTQTSSDDDDDDEVEFDAPPKKRTRRVLSRVPETQEGVMTVAGLPAQIKADIRRSYCNMFANIMNSFDPQVVQNFMQNYCHHDVVMVNECGHAANLCLPARMEFHGVQPMFEFWHGRLVMFPDTIMDITDTKICTRSDWDDGYSQVVIKFTIQGTKIYDLDLDEWMPTAIVDREGNMTSSSSSSSTAPVSAPNTTVATAVTTTATTRPKDKNFSSTSSSSLAPSSLSGATSVSASSTMTQFSRSAPIISAESVGKAIPTTATSATSSVSSSFPARDRVLPPQEAWPDCRREKEAKRQLLTPETLPDISKLTLSDFAKVEPNPVRMNVEGAMVIHVNQFDQISRIDFKSTAMNLTSPVLA